MIGLGKWASTVNAVQSARLKARKKKTSFKGKSSLSKKGPVSSPGESAAVHFVQSDLVNFSDGTDESDNDPAVVSTVETLSVTGSDALVVKQEKEARSSGGDPIPMNVDKALANFCNSSELRRGGDTGKGRVEHRNILQLRFTHHKM